MVAGQDEDGVLIPRLTTGIFKESSDGHISIADAFMDDDALFGIDILVFLRNMVGMMRGCREDGRHKGFFHLRHLGAVILQEGFIPDGPHTIEVLVAPKAVVCTIVLATIIFLESSAAGKGHKTHRTALGPMEEGCLVTLANQEFCDAADFVHRGRCQEEGFYEHRNARQDAGHTIDALTSVTITVREGDTLCDQRVYMGRVSFVVAILQGLVQCSDILPAKTFNDQYNNVLLDKRDAVGRCVDRGIDGFQFFLTTEVLRHFEDVLADGTIE